MEVVTLLYCTYGKQDRKAVSAYSLTVVEALGTVLGCETDARVVPSFCHDLVTSSVSSSHINQTGG